MGDEIVAQSINVNQGIVEIEPTTSKTSTSATNKIDVTSLDQKTKNDFTVQMLLDLAQSQMEQKKLSTPASDNALDTYRMVLQFNPTNEVAISGIQEIKDRYRTWAKLDIEKGNINRARYFIKLALSISPEDNESKIILSSIE